MVEVHDRAARGMHSRFSRRSVMNVLAGNRITYALGGAMTAAVYYALLGLGLLAAKGSVHYLVLIVVSHFATVVIIYPWYRLVVFQYSGDSWLRGYVRFYVVGLGFLGVSVIGLPILVELARIPIMVAQGIVIFLNPPLSYLIHRTWTFRGGGSL